MNPQDLRDNTAQSRFEHDEGGYTAYADYARSPGLLVIYYVYAPPPLRGTGAADRLMAQIGDLAIREGRTISALCGFARLWLRRKPDYRDLLV